MQIKFKSFSSGSCGNCYFLGIYNEESRHIEAGVLIDAGVSLRRVRMELEREGFSTDDFSSIIISHDHWDHIRSIGSYCKKLHRPIHTSPTLRKALIRRPGTGEYLKAVARELEEGWNELVPGRISARFFRVPHDATETIGFAILADGHRYVHITDCGRMTEEAMNWCRQADTVVATDLGCVRDSWISVCSDCQLVMLESNYDPDMLRTGPYPPDLQERIRGGHGHMSNEECAAAICGFAHNRLKRIFLCHLSEHNNTPELAIDTCRAAAGGSRLTALPRQTPTQLINL